VSTQAAARESFSRSTRGPGVGSAVGSEFIKLTSVPAQRALMLVAIGVAALTAVVFFVSLPVSQGRGVGDLEPGELLGVGILGSDAAAFVMIILAAVHVGSEYSTGMIQSTLTITPARGRVLAGKLISVGVTALVVGTVAAAVCVGIALVVAEAVGVDPGLILTPTGIRLALGSVTMSLCYAMIAASATFVFRRTALGIAVALVVMAVGGLAGWFGDQVSAVLTPLMPVAAIHSLSGTASGPESIGVARASLSLVVWIGISIGAAAWRLFRRDA